MKKKIFALVLMAVLSFATLSLASPTVYPSGTTIYDPAKASNGFTILTMGAQYVRAGVSTYLINMNGQKVHDWPGLMSMPAKVFPGGYVIGFDEYFDVNQDTRTIQIRDFDNKVFWDFADYADYKDGEKWSRMHHDVQIWGNPVGYYAPELVPDMNSKMLVLGHDNVKDKAFAPEHELLDDVIYEVDMKTKKIIWSWNISDSFDELGFNEVSKKTIAKNPLLGTNPFVEGRKLGDWAHINSASYVGPNKWWDEDPVKYAAFNPENVIWDARDLNIIGITDRQGKVVWKVGPYYNGEHPEKKLGWIIGQHHAHIIPKGLPGAGNLIVFDNGGFAGYDAPSINSPGGNFAARRDYSRVIEFNPITLDIVWEYSPKTAKTFVMDNVRFYSPYISSAQRLENGNTLITEGSFGRIFEVTADYEIVWEHIAPAVKGPIAGGPAYRQVYRAYRVPYAWVPQLAKQVETAVTPELSSDSRVPSPIVPVVK